MKLDFLLICKNNEEYFRIIFPKLIEKLKIFEPRFFIYENNSIDNTKLILKYLSKKYNNIFIKSENLNSSNLNRFLNICIARNKLLDFYKEINLKYNNDNEWVILLDTNIIFDHCTITELLNKTKYNGVMYCSNTLYFDFMNNKPKYYYDLLALNYGEYFRVKDSNNFLIENYLPIHQNEQNLFKIDTGFGGLVLIKKDILLKYYWHLIKPDEVLNKNISKNVICEHWYLCKNIKKLGNIYIVKNSKAIWYMDKYMVNNDNRIEFYNYLKKIKFF